MYGYIDKEISKMVIGISMNCANSATAPVCNEQLGHEGATFRFLSKFSVTTDLASLIVMCLFHQFMDC